MKNELNVLESPDGKFIYIFAIIDTLTYFSGFKQLEYLSKCIFQGQGASCCPPDKYASRFLEFLKNNVFEISKFDESIIVNEDDNYGGQNLDTEERQLKMEGGE